MWLHNATRLEEGRSVDVYVAKVESDSWLSPEIAAKAPKDAQPFFQSAQGSSCSETGFPKVAK
jgi:hypothetical protein